KNLEQKLGYYFSYSGFTTLLLYVIITKYRIQMERSHWKPFSKELHPVYLQLARKLLSNYFTKQMTAHHTESEIEALALMLSAMEIGDITQPVFTMYFSDSETTLSKILNQTLLDIEDISGFFLTFDRSLKNVLVASLATVLIRAQNKISIWHESWLEKRIENTIEKAFIQSIKRHIYQELKIDLQDRRLRNLQLSFSAIFEDNRRKIKRAVRTCIVCFEGIGLATYIRARLEMEFPDLHIVDTLSYQRIDQEYIMENNIQFIISTYPLTKINIPSFVIEVPFEENRVQKPLKKAINELRKNMTIAQDNKDLSIPPKEVENKNPFSVEIILRIIDSFFCYHFENINDIEMIIPQVMENLQFSPEENKKIFADFMEREKHGTLIFEEYQVRILHCRSSTLKKPIAGVIQLDDKMKLQGNYNCIFMIASPKEVDKKVLNTLSSLITALSEESDFSHVLAYSSLEAIKEYLMWMFGNFLHF
ncbi:MAG: PTS sugar transporter subunit IIA, partial [Spirochaetes bacterium]|nr:PTS sugar transporter subunit IIA [Spirochaetota bacterium]